MGQKLPKPECKAFLICREIGIHTKTGELILVGLPTNFAHRRFPAAMTCGVFARLASAHGIEVQLQSPEGEVFWKDGPPAPWDMSNPLVTADLRLNLNIVFPSPGIFDVVLLANGDEISRQRFAAVLLKPTKRK
jgi:hypothetical protein